MKAPHFGEIVGSVLTLVAALVLGYAALMQDNADARGALILVVGGGVQYFLRGRVERPAH